MGCVFSALALFIVSAFTKPLPQDFIDELFAPVDDSLIYDET